MATMTIYELSEKIETLRNLSSEVRYSEGKVLKISTRDEVADLLNEYADRLLSIKVTIWED